MLLVRYNIAFGLYSYDSKQSLHSSRYLVFALVFLFHLTFVVVRIFPDYLDVGEVHLLSVLLISFIISPTVSIILWESTSRIDEGLKLPYYSY